MDGRPIHRLTYNGISITAATWSSDGRYIANSPGKQIGDEKLIIIIDNIGQKVSKIVEILKEAMTVLDILIE
jgi:hypothetical protein